MTKYKFLTDEKGIYGFIIKVHSGYGEQGGDIVCAAVSSAAYMVINTITDIFGIKADITESDACLGIELRDSDAYKCGKLLQGLKLHLDGLREQYPEHITPEE